MFSHLVDRITTMLQSDREVILKGFEIQFHFILIPDGGCGTESREKHSILNKTSVNCIKNKDNNCFWYALVNLVYANYGKKRKSKWVGKYKQI